jgi:uncharacterized protein YeaO (DUF488 family)
MMNIQQKRIYDAPSETDGLRILADRLWPRGIKKENAKIDLWSKEITPSSELRKWYHEDMENRWEEFRQRYTAELKQQTEALNELRQLASKQTLTLLTSAKNEGLNHLTVLKQVLESGGSE